MICETGLGKLALSDLNNRPVSNVKNEQNYSQAVSYDVRKHKPNKFCLRDSHRHFKWIFQRSLLSVLLNFNILQI